jgi:predicted RNA binding protein YcfA (HicA-like mRNA interferase family)
MPRDLSGDDLIKKLLKLGYVIVRQKGSHVRLSKNYYNEDHPITIPKHNPIKIGTLNNILSDLSEKMKISKSELIRQLFE